MILLKLPAQQIFIHFPPKDGNFIFVAGGQEYPLPEGGGEREIITAMCEELLQQNKCSRGRTGDDADGVNIYYMANYSSKNKQKNGLLCNVALQNCCFLNH